MLPVPLPDEGDVPVNTGETFEMGPGEKTVVSVTPETAGSTHKIPVVSIDKLRGATYEVRVDGTNRYGPSPIPPRDPNDTGVAFLPALDLERELKVIVKDIRGTGNPRRYDVRVMGWQA